MDYSCSVYLVSNNNFTGEKEMKEIKIDVDKLREEDIKQQAIRDNMNYWRGYSDGIKYAIKLLLKKDE